MMAGHAALAFALVASVASRRVDRRRALLLGLAAAAFATVPDVDMVLAVVGLVESGATGVWTATAAFWGGAHAVHRVVTHSLVLAVPAAAGFALVAAGRRVVAGTLLGSIVAAVLLLGGPTAATMMAAYVAAGVAVAVVAVRAGLGPWDLLATALVGLLTHPFGDLFTGTPPAFLYPLEYQFVAERLVLHPDPTTNLLAVFGIELVALWLAVVAATRLYGQPIGAHLDWRATAGAGYGAVAVVLPAPTMEVSYHFVFSVLAVGTVGAPMSRRVGRADLARAGVTGLAAVTLGVFAAAVVYSLL